LKLDLILHYKRLILGADWLAEFGRDGVVGSLVLDQKTLVADHTVENSWLLDSPVADVCPLLSVLFLVILLLCVRGFPSRLPIVCELFKEGTLEFGGGEGCLRHR